MYYIILSYVFLKFNCKLSVILLNYLYLIFFKDFLLFKLEFKYVDLNIFYKKSRFFELWEVVVKGEDDLEVRFVSNYI